MNCGIIFKKYESYIASKKRDELFDSNIGKLRNKSLYSKGSLTDNEAKILSKFINMELKIRLTMNDELFGAYFPIRHDIIALTRYLNRIED